MDYYTIAGEASLHINGHPGMEYLRSAIKPGSRVLDVGCGEGSRLNTLLPAGLAGYGLDANPKAIALARSSFPRHHFRVGLGEKLPYPSHSFDLVYSAFTIEHCQDPTRFIREMIRVCRPGGQVVFLAPNYGAPNRRSPVSVVDPVTKLAEGLVRDFLPYPGLDWAEVTPKDTYDEIDTDTTFEPYLLSLLRYISRFPVKLVVSSSLWELEASPVRFHHRLFAFLGRLKIFPFRYWGPQLFLAVNVT